MNLSMVMTTRLNLIIALLTVLLTAFGCSRTGGTAMDEKAVSRVLDAWHQAAAEAEYERYFSHFSSDSAIFMGTDATERWTAGEFKEWAKPYFESGDAWNFSPEERHIYFSDNGNTAWFDESLDTPNLGPARGSGVMVKQNDSWRIAHYNLSIPIPNAIVDTVVRQVREALQDSVSN